MILFCTPKKYISLDKLLRNQKRMKEPFEFKDRAIYDDSE